MLCVVCEKPIPPSRRKRVTCSSICSTNRYKPKHPIVTLHCAQCTTLFEGRANRRFCKPACSDNFFTAKYLAAKEAAGGSYVYLWFDANAVLPYYIGSGVMNRAWREHGDLRMPARVEIVRANMTPDQALAAEAALIAAFRLCSAPLENIR